MLRGVPRNVGGVARRGAQCVVFTVDAQLFVKAVIMESIETGPSAEGTDYLPGWCTRHPVRIAHAYFRCAQSSSR